MAVLFSSVTASDDKSEVKFFVGGIPRDVNDLEGWTAFENFTADICEEREIAVHAEAYQYGEGKKFNATPEEIAYFMKRIEMQPNFLSSRCESVGGANFTFQWSPGEDFGMEMG